MEKDNHKKTLSNKLDSSSGIERLLILDKLCKEFAGVSSEKFLKYSMMGYEMIDDKVDTGLQAEFHRNTIVALLNCGKMSEIDSYIDKARIFISSNENGDQNSRAEYFKALNIFKNLEKYYDDNEEYDSQIRVKINLGLGYHYLTQYDRAIEAFYSALKISREAGDVQHVFSVHTNMGNTFNKLKDRVNAIEHYEKALKIAGDNQDNEQLSSCYINIGTYYFWGDDYEKSLIYFKKSLKLAEKTNNMLTISNCYINIGRAYYEMGDLDEADKLYLMGLEFAEKNNFVANIASVCSNLANLRKQNGAIEQADHMFRRSITIYRELGSKLEHSEMLGDYAVFLAKQRNYKHAFKCMQEKAEIDKTISMDNQTKTIADLNAKYEIETKEKEAELINQKNVELQFESEEREKVIKELEEALSNIKVLSGLVPICSHCKSIRDDSGFWNKIESYISEHTDAIFSHGICPGCMKKHYPNISTSSANIS